MAFRKLRCRVCMGPWALQVSVSSSASAEEKLWFDPPQAKCQERLRAVNEWPKTVMR
jgi:hypothetical protein